MVIDKNIYIPISSYIDESKFKNVFIQMLNKNVYLSIQN